MDIPHIEIDELDRHLLDDAALIDVREDDEWAAAHIDGAAHIPLHTIPDRLDELDSGSPVYVICARGGRSAQAVDFLRSRDFDAINVEGGMMAWLDAQKPSIAGST